MLLSSMEAFSGGHVPAFTSNKDFKLRIMATNWGFHGTTHEYCAKVKQEGYDGIECWWPLEKKSQDELFAALKEFDLDIGFLCGSGERDYKIHFDQFRNMVDAAAG